MTNPSLDDPEVARWAFATLADASAVGPATALIRWMLYSVLNGPGGIELTREDFDRSARFFAEMVPIGDGERGVVFHLWPKDGGPL